MNTLLAAVYGRTSKETDDAYSVSSQIDAGLLYARTNGLVVPDQYVFREDYTGRALDRPAYGKIRTLIKQQKIKAVIIYATDRLARKVSVGEIFLDEMVEYGVELHIVAWGTNVKNTPEDKLRFNFETTFSSFERDKIVERTRRGKMKKATQGGLVGNMRPLYGYALNEHKTGYVLGEYAPIVREVLLAYGVQHINPSKIAKTLQARGIKTPGAIHYDDLMAGYKRKYEAGRLDEEQYRQKQQYASRQLGQNLWLPNNIYIILRNHQAYAGDYEFSVNGQPFHLPIPPIISQEEAAAVAHMLSVGKRRFARKTAPDSYLMSRRLTCGICSYSYRVAPKARDPFYFYYRCSGQRRRNMGNGCTNPCVRGEVIDELTQRFVKELLLHPDRLFRWWQLQHEQDTRANEEMQQQIVDIDRRLEEVQGKFNRTLDRLTDNLDADEVAYYTQQRDALKQLLTEYRDEQAGLVQKLIVTSVDPQVIQNFGNMGKEYRETLETSTDITFWRGLVDDLDITGIIGIDEEHRRYIDFVVFGQPRKREYFDATGHLEPSSTRNAGPGRSTELAGHRLGVGAARRSGGGLAAARRSHPLYTRPLPALAFRRHPQRFAVSRGSSG
ncbi:MAG: recombinase family protein [Chloroflexi bacterium]|nr:recombinase family protein [Chloroflexota bacterium]